MAYVDHAKAKSSKGAIITVGAIHAVIGYGLIVGLAPTLFETIDPGPLEGYQIKLPPPPPPPEVPQQQTDLSAPVSPPIYTPPSAKNLNPDPIQIDTTKVLLPAFKPIELTPGPIGTPKPFPSATTPSFTPVAVRPRNDPGAWVTTNDYRSSWINREMVGTAGFKVQVGANGRTESCLITQSSGHDALDKATCELISKRARFEPAKNDKGEKVGGTYSSSVRWQLPE